MACAVVRRPPLIYATSAPGPAAGERMWRFPRPRVWPALSGLGGPMRTSLVFSFAAVGAAFALALPAQADAAAPSVGPLSLASGPSPFAGCTSGLDPGSPPGTNYLNAEVEPFVADDPASPSDLIAVYQQDRWSNGGARGLVTAVSSDGGSTWTEPAPPHFSTCAGGTAANGGAYDRSSDPWVSIGPDGRAYQVSLSVNAAQTISAILASTSADGGVTWSEPATIQRDDSPDHFVFNDKESVTADPFQAGTAYVVWDRSRFPSDSANVNAGNSFAFRGDPMFSKTTDGGRTWSTPTRISPQNNNMFTIGNQIAVEPDGTLVDVFHFGKGSGFDAPNASFTGVARSTRPPGRCTSCGRTADSAAPTTTSPCRSRRTAGRHGRPRRR